MVGFGTMRLTNRPYRLTTALIGMALTVAPIAAQETRALPESAPAAASRPGVEADEKIVVSGVVVDEAGAPAAGVEVAQCWSFENGKRRRFEFLTTGADGRFAGSLEGNRDRIALVAFTADDQSAGWVVGARDALRDVKIRLKPSIRVRLSVTCRETGDPPEWANTNWSLMPDTGAAGLLVDRLRSKRSEISVLGTDGTNGLLELRAPQGSYLWEVYDQDWSTRYGTKDLVADKRDVEIRGVRLPAAFVARQRGKPAPDWNVTATRGAPPGKRQPSDFRGKWLIVEFWGYW